MMHIVIQKINKNNVRWT